MVSVSPSLQVVGHGQAGAGGTTDCPMMTSQGRGPGAVLAVQGVGLPGRCFIFVRDAGRGQGPHFPALRRPDPESPHPPCLLHQGGNRRALSSPGAPAKQWGHTPFGEGQEVSAGGRG